MKRFQLAIVSFALGFLLMNHLLVEDMFFDISKMTTVSKVRLLFRNRLDQDTLASIEFISSRHFLFNWIYNGGSIEDTRGLRHRTQFNRISSRLDEECSDNTLALLIEKAIQKLYWENRDSLVAPYAELVFQTNDKKRLKKELLSILMNEENIADLLSNDQYLPAARITGCILCPEMNHTADANICSLFCMAPDKVSVLEGVVRNPTTNNPSVDASSELSTITKKWRGVIEWNLYSTNPVVSVVEKNTTVNELFSLPELPDGVVGDLAQMFASADEDEVWRDYCLQFLGSALEREDGVTDADRALARETLVKALASTNATFAGTALRALHRGDPSDSLVVSNALRIARDSSYSAPSRTTALLILEECVPATSSTLAETAASVSADPTASPVLRQAADAIRRRHAVSAPEN